MTASFFDLVRTGGASFDAPGFAAEELSQLLHAAVDLLPPSDAAALSSRFDEPHGGSFADLLGHQGHVAVESIAFDFGAGADHHGFEAHGQGHWDDGGALHHVDTGDDGWAHHDLFEDAHHVEDHGHHEIGLHDDLLHDHHPHHDDVVHHDDGGHDDSSHDGGHHRAEWHDHY